MSYKNKVIDELMKFSVFIKYKDYKICLDEAKMESYFLFWKNVQVVFHLYSDSEGLDKQRFTYNFSSFQDMQTNLMNLKIFILTLYESPEEIEAKNKYFRDKLLKLS